MRIITAGESHGECETAILEGFPKGVRISKDKINEELFRRMSGYGRGARMEIEKDAVAVLSGMRNGMTLGSPITMQVKNYDHRIFDDKDDKQKRLTVPRPAHADLPGLLKYGANDVRDILERSSARETVARVCAGSVCKQFLDVFDIKIRSFTVSIGSVLSDVLPKNINEIISKTGKSELNTIDPVCERKFISEIDKAKKNKDSIGGIIEIWAQGVCAGLGSFMHYDRRLDAALAGYLMGIPGIKGVEIGAGFDYSKGLGSKMHDEIFYSNKKGFYKRTNHSGGIDGGMSNGNIIICRIAMKPIATLMKPLSSVDIDVMKKRNAVIERSDTCAVAACGVIAESMIAIAIVEKFLDKFGTDNLIEIKKAYNSYIKNFR
ncbi:MAG: chorismate synthase [Candidatus Omnitrophica bacterium]|nr:chorismate synthase [Candidatus Omnitrophota bacterium]MDD5080917.1 chorismate synthase [Candidatus Omnitrophota bacterium]